MVEFWSQKYFYQHGFIVEKFVFSVFDFQKFWRIKRFLQAQTTNRYNLFRWTSAQLKGTLWPKKFPGSGFMAENIDLMTYEMGYNTSILEVQNFPYFYLSHTVTQDSSMVSFC